MDELGLKSLMQRALMLASRAEGDTSPNPMVGAIVLQGEHVVGEGWHRRAGGPHAEVHALKAAGEEARGGTMLVTLEPCCHHGRTPPCTDAIIKAGIRKVYYASTDTNPQVKGEGHRLLEEAGIEVHRGLCEAEARHLNRAFFHFITQKLPYVTAKYAMSLDGCIASASGTSQWITQPEARALGHKLRDISDAIMVGTSTVLRDNPSLTARLPEGQGRHPIRVVLDAMGRIPLDANLFQISLPGTTWVVTGPDIADAYRDTLLSSEVEVIQTDLNKEGRIALRPLLEKLAARNIMTMMVEGGPTLLGSFFDEDLIQEVWAFVGAKLIGGEAAPSPFGGRGRNDIAEAAPVSIYDVVQVEGDILMKALVQTHFG
jgi:diaminohydroxyphosphoribosylaminopyrimidine deaminase/5-amino-6-(5-phosphoribosylamino)uracil reductase